jgi:putative membrane protein
MYYHLVMKLLLHLLVATTAVLVSAYIIPNVFVDTFLTAIVVAIVLGVLNTFIRPIITLLTLPVNLLTLGLFSLVINTALVMFAAYIVPGFDVATILAAFLFSIVISLINSFLGSLVK